jgi:hypothetical protein
MAKTQINAWTLSAQIVNSRSADWKTGLVAYAMRHLVLTGRRPELEEVFASIKGKNAHKFVATVAGMMKLGTIDEACAILRGEPVLG